MENNPSGVISNDNLRILLDLILDLPEFEGIDLNGVDVLSRLNNTPLHIASIWGDVDAIKLLVEAGANINAQGEHGYTPLHEYIEQGHYNAAKTLILLGASMEIANNDGLTPAQLAALLGENRILQLFTQHTLPKRTKS